MKWIDSYLWWETYETPHNEITSEDHSYRPKPVSNVFPPIYIQRIFGSKISSGKLRRTTLLFKRPTKELLYLLKHKNAKISMPIPHARTYDTEDVEDGLVVREAEVAK